MMVPARTLASAVDDAAPGDVDHAHAILHLRERLVVDEAERLGVLGQVHGDEVRLAIDLLRRLGTLEVELAKALHRHVGVVGDDVHAKALGPLRHEEADAAEPDDTERLVLHLDAGPLRLLPATVLQSGVRLRDVARAGHDHGDRVLGRRENVALGGVHDHDAAPGRRLDVDVVDAHAGAPDHLETAPGLDDLSRDPGR
jgi:hypothetical protein